MGMEQKKLVTFSWKGKRTEKEVDVSDVANVLNEANDIYPIAETGFMISDFVLGYHHLGIAFDNGTMTAEWE